MTACVTAGETAQCERCKGSGEIGCRTRDAGYVGAGPVPEDARGVFAARCDECRGSGRVALTNQGRHEGN